MAEKDLDNGARSFKSQTIGSDSFALTINIKWLIQLIALIISLTYAFYSYQTKLNYMEAQIERHRQEIETLLAVHEAEEEVRVAELEESIKWYEKEMVKVGNVSLNPFSWKNKKKKKNK